ncbi:hypothetical protein N9F71_00635 [bacterium]|nr:hypothetical protein [bacterium]
MKNKYENYQMKHDYKINTFKKEPEELEPFSMGSPVEILSTLIIAATFIVIFTAYMDGRFI